MKKATFIAVMATAVVMLTGCGEEASDRAQENANHQESDVSVERYISMELYEEDMKAKEAEIADLKDRVEVLEAGREETSENSETASRAETSVVVENAETGKVPLIPKNQENIHVSALYHEKEIPLYVATEEKRAESINNAKIITVKDANGKDVRDRDLSIVIDGVSVSNVYIVDKEFKEVEGLSCDSVDNTYSVYYYMPRGGQYTFLIQTTNGTHYYVTVVY